MEESDSDSKIDNSLTQEREKVLLNRSWSFWENYESKNREEKNYSKLLKEIYTFGDLISFWQFWNKYPGSDTKQVFYNGECIKYFFKEKYRIIAMNLFEKGIRPEWEDEKNKKGNILTLSYTAKSEDFESFLVDVGGFWIKLICLLIGESFPFCNNINGIRFVDKTKYGFYTKVMVIFKYEIWVNSKMSEKELDELKTYCYKEFGCQGTIKPMK